MTKNSTCETIGCDIGDKTSEICALRHDGGGESKPGFPRHERSDEILQEARGSACGDGRGYALTVDEPASRGIRSSGDGRGPATVEDDQRKQHQRTGGTRNCWCGWEEPARICSRRSSIATTRCRRISRWRRRATCW